MKAKKTPLRTCLACGRQATKREFVRIVRTPDGDVVVDPTGRRNGRGAYVCPSTECFEKAVRKNKFDAALRVSLRDDDVERLRRDYEQALEE
ncbi:MAG: YlxR family protein [Coriobacteriales bacterium]|nr:YlxR family protein [Actinomycetes bacterium]